MTMAPGLRKLALFFDYHAPDPSLYPPVDPRVAERPLFQFLERAGLWLHDRLGSATGLPASETIDVTHHPLGNALRRPFGTALEYSGCIVDDGRLVIPIQTGRDEPQDLRLYTRHGDEVSYRSLFPVLFVPLRTG